MLIEPTSLPIEGRIARIDATTTAATTDLSAAGQLSTAVNCGLTFEIVSDAAVWVKTAFASGTEVSSSDTTTAARGFLLPANSPKEFTFHQGPPGTGLNKFISLQAVTGTAHVAIAVTGKMRG